MIKITENMKRILFFLVTLLFVNLAKAQEIVDYYIGDIVVGDKYEYKLYQIVTSNNIPHYMYPLNRPILQVLILVLNLGYSLNLCSDTHA